MRRYQGGDLIRKNAINQLTSRKSRLKYASRIIKCDGGVTQSIFYRPEFYDILRKDRFSYYGIELEFEL